MTSSMNAFLWLQQQSQEAGQQNNPALNGMLCYCTLYLVVGYRQHISTDGASSDMTFKCTIYSFVLQYLLENPFVQLSVGIYE